MVLYTIAYAQYTNQTSRKETSETTPNGKYYELRFTIGTY